ncbi:restriction endonuclease subunit S [Leuconostoc mesenteroides]|uniref:restriction endonuclease subunit S n=1 Tax=Leuconostoc mesenteroides TaxID=1245 RepID=UPI00385F0991
MQTKKRKSPSLRFRGYTDDWEERKVKDIFKITRGQVLAATETSEEKSDISPFPVYSSQTKNNGLMGYYKDYLFDTAITWTTDGANAGTVRYRSGRFYSTNVNGVLISDKGYTNKAISEILNLEAWKWVSHVGNPKLMNNVMGDISIMIPSSFEEQDRLSDFLNQLDDTIALHQRKLDLLKEQKKGFLQKMFPKNGAKVPELRFEGFSDDWEERKLGDVVGEIQSGNRLPKDSLTNGDVPYVVAQTKNDGVFKKIARGTLDYNGNPMKLFPGNSISFSIDNPEAMFYRNAEYYTSNIMRVIHEDHLTHEQYVFILENMKRFIRGYDWSRKFSGPVVSNLEYLQPSEEEQQKIGSFFKQLDDTIALHQRKLDLLKEQKKGFLQKMFV